MFINIQKLNLDNAKDIVGAWMGRVDKAKFALLQRDTQSYFDFINRLKQEVPRRNDCDAKAGNFLEKHQDMNEMSWQERSIMLNMRIKEKSLERQKALGESGSVTSR